MRVVGKRPNVEQIVKNNNWKFGQKILGGVKRIKMGWGGDYDNRP